MLGERWSARSPLAPCAHSVHRKDHACWMNGCFMSHCWQRVALWYRGIPNTVSNCCSDDRLIHSLLWCSQLHLDAQVLSHSPSPCNEKVARSLSHGWGPEAQWGRLGVSNMQTRWQFPPPLAAGASTVASCKPDPDVSGNRHQRRRNLERVSTCCSNFPSN